MTNYFKYSSAILITVSSAAIAQDTICFKNNTCINAKVTEINVHDVRYFKTENVNGPQYVVSKSEVNYIKYFNGVTDTIKYVKVIADTVRIFAAENNRNKVEVVNKKIFFEGERISESELTAMFMHCPDAGKKEKLLHGMKQVKFCKVQQCIYKPVGLGAGFLTVLLTAPLVTNRQYFGFDYPQHTWNIAAAGIVGGAVMRISGCVMSKIFENKRKHKLEGVAQLYNNN